MLIKKYEFKVGLVVVPLYYFNSIFVIFVTKSISKINNYEKTDLHRIPCSIDLYWL